MAPGHPSPHLCTHPGPPLASRLTQAGVACSYGLLSGAPYMAREATKVLLGAAAVLSNGTVMARAGSAAVAMLATDRALPVLVCCEAHKFHERVQLDSITHNELGAWHDRARLNLAFCFFLFTNSCGAQGH